MKFVTTAAFDRDVKKLSDGHFKKFHGKVVPDFVDAAERAAAGETDPWPRAMRIKKVEGAHGVWEMTWSWNDPDGRATWEWIEIDSEPAIRWRRVGTHEIFNAP